MYFLDKKKEIIAKKINKIFKKNIVDKSILTYPPISEMGDLSLPCFSLAKQLKKNPHEIAEFLLKELSSFLSNDFSLQVVGPYLNFKFNNKILLKVLEEISKKKDEYGKNNLGSKKRVMVEYSNVNTHKQYHIGHLRNLCYGDSVCRLLSISGYDVIPVSYINDFGIHIAKTLWAFSEFQKSGKDIGKIKNKGEFLGNLYVEATRKLKEQPHFKEVVNFLMKKIESRQGEEYELWKKTREWSIEQFDRIYKEMNINFEHIFYESEFIDRGFKIVKNLLAKRILKKSEGAIIADLEKYGLGVLVVLRSDGTALYPVADIPLAQEKFEKYNLDISIYVVDNRQTLYFKQLFKVLELLGYKQEMVHLAYDFVKLPDGMISSRSGNIITYEELNHKLREKIYKETCSRHPDWSQEKIEKVVNVLSVGTIKFEMLKIGADQIITFDINKALSLDGFTIAYLEYTAARISSILRKASKQKSYIKEEIQINEKERSLIMVLAKYPEVVKKASKNYNPSEIAKYLFDLSRLFNDYYHQVKILNTNIEREFRLFLIKSIRQIINNGLKLLGIECLEEM